MYSPTTQGLIFFFNFRSPFCGQFQVQTLFESLQVLAQPFSFSAVFSFFEIFPWAAARQHCSSLERSDCFEKSTRTGIYSYFLSEKELCWSINNFLENAHFDDLRKFLTGRFAFFSKIFLKTSKKNVKKGFSLFMLFYGVSLSHNLGKN